MADVSYRTFGSIIQGGFPGEVTGFQNGGVDWTDLPTNPGDFFSSYYFYHDSPTASMSNATRVTVSFDYFCTWTRNPDNSVSISGDAQIINIVRTANPGISSGNYNLQMTVNDPVSGGVIWQSAVTNMTTLGVVPGFSPPVTIPFNFTLAPYATSETAQGFILFFNDIVGTAVDDRFQFGIQFRNNLPPDYRPGSVMNNGVELSCNRSGGWNSVMNNGVEAECRTQDGHVGTGNPPTAMVSGQELNQLKVGAGG